MYERLFIIAKALMKIQNILIVFLLSMSPVFSAEKVAFYISPNGNDAWSGRFAEPAEDDGPFATVERAQQAVRELKQSEELSGPVYVYFRGGVYELNKPIIFTPEDSGEPGAPIIYKAWNNEDVLISGGVELTGWRLLRDNRWICDIPQVKESGWKFQQLFVNGERRYRARTPNKGFYRVKDPMEESGTPFHHYRYKFGFYPGDLLSNWSNIQDIEIVLLNFWSDAHCPIAGIDPESLIVTLATPSWRKFTDDNTSEGARYFVENVYEALDEPGEWYLDRHKGRLTYLSMPGEDMNAAAVIAPRLDQLVLFKGDPVAQRYVENITLFGLTFAYSEWSLPPGDAGDHQAADTVPAAVEAVGARNIRIEHNTLEHLATYGVELQEGCSNVVLRKNRLFDLGGGGVKFSGGRAGSDSLLKTHHITVADNSLRQLGRLYKASVGVLCRHASDNVISHNLIRDLFYTGISVGWEWGYKPSAAYNNLVEYNRVEDIGQGLLSDMGGIYMLGVSPGTVVRNNLVHNVYSHGYGGWGIYTDEGSSDILIEKNIVYDTKSAGFHQHYGKDNIVRNNIFAYGQIAQVMRSRNEEHLSFKFERNIIYWKGSELLDKKWDGDTTRFYFQNNLYYREDDQPIRFTSYTVEKWRELGQDTSSIFEDPRFVNPQKGDFNLLPDSPAFKIGFEPIDMISIGPRLWPHNVKTIRYLSLADSTLQPALFYDSGADAPRPLLVGLHTWSGNYLQGESVPYFRWCQMKDWAFIHPDFRGPNKRPEATGSDLVVGDIVSAVEYAKEHASIDTTRIYLIGVSGGGYTGLQMAAKAPDVWTAVSVWASLTDLKEWYEESLRLGNRRYADMVVASCGGEPGAADSIDAEYFKRSPRNFLQNARDIPLDINAGIHDGHTGSVPISHSLRAFNVLADDEDKISEQDIAAMVQTESVPDTLITDAVDPYYGEKKVLLRRQSNNARITVFDGGHEILPNAALHWLQDHAKK